MLFRSGKVRHSPNFKPDWSPDTLMSLMYTCHFSVYRKSIAEEIGYLRVGYEGSQDYDFVMRFTEKTNHIAHIPKILYHWRERRESTSLDVSAKPYILDAAQKAKEDALVRRNLKGTVELVPNVYQYRMIYTDPNNSLVSIIIPSKDNYDILRQCIVTLIEKTAYKNYEIIVVDNGSNDKNRILYSALCKQYGILYHHEEFVFNFSHMCNMGRDLAKGDILLFLNDDIEIISDIWLERMVGQVTLPHAGAVGAKLLYPDNNIIQHAGVISIHDGPVHGLAGFDDNILHAFARNKIDFNYAAVTDRKSVV